MDLLFFLVVDALGVMLEELEDFFVFVAHCAPMVLELGVILW